MKLALSCLSTEQKERSNRWENVTENHFYILLLLEKHTIAKPSEKDKHVTHEMRCLNLQTRVQKNQEVIIIKKHMEKTNGSFDIYTILIREYLDCTISHSF